MSTPYDEPAAPAPSPAGPRTNPILVAVAWMVIVGAVSAMVVLRELGLRGAIETKPEIDPGQLAIQQMMGRYIVGAKLLLGPSPDEMEKVLKQFPVNDVPQMLCLAILEGELKEPFAAEERLRDITPVSADEAYVHGILSRLYDNYLEKAWDAPSLTDQERADLRAKLGWFGDLALNPARTSFWKHEAAVVGAASTLAPAPAEGPPRERVAGQALQTLTTLLAGVIGAAIAGFLGLIGLILLIVFASRGGLQAGMGKRVDYHGVYVETFALWMIVFAGSLLLVDRLLPLDMLEASGVSMLLSLSVVLWPRLRGVPWRQVRRDIGWTAGEAPALEPVLGIACYFMSLPLLAVGLLIYLLLTGGQGAFGLIAAQEPPTHPIVEYLLNDDPVQRLKIFLLASVIAPIVEETMFRGVLYRHVRDATRSFGGGWSFIASAFLVSFLFAAVHPQGWLGVPLLMGLAIGMTMAREWRGSLIPSMVLHGVSNGLVLTFVMVAVG